jgi:hypothetical protein
MHAGHKHNKEPRIRKSVRAKNFQGKLSIGGDAMVSETPTKVRCGTSQCYYGRALSCSGGSAAAAHSKVGFSFVLWWLAEASQGLSSLENRTTLVRHSPLECVDCAPHLHLER